MGEFQPVETDVPVLLDFVTIAQDLLLLFGIGVAAVAMLFLSLSVASRIVQWSRGGRGRWSVSVSRDTAMGGAYQYRARR